MIKMLLLLHRLISNTRCRHYLEKKIAAKDGGWAYSKTIRKIYTHEYGLTIGYGTYGGCWTNESMKWQNIKIGNYCSFAGHINIFRANHPANIFTTHPITYNPVMGGVKRYALKKEDLVIGNDVWIGQNAIILPGCNNIGNGAIVGAGAIVTKDVPPYAVVAGNPAKVIKYRFTPEIISKIEKSQWWLLEKDELATQMGGLIELTNDETRKNIN